ncbi:MAG: hypothetical protein A2Y73_05085 [Chloroflexi bacterium RBG_13_56_8]|nr:MAG: hypothetical protein A2Y73_05085 [Chloroflexi bacterium RBG_13_56_8]
MSSDTFEFNPVSRITVGAIGRPGQRTFFLQASYDVDMISLKMEKEQVYALARGIDEILNELEQREVQAISRLEEPPASDLQLQEPIEPAFVVGQMGLAFDSSTKMMVLVLQGLPGEEGEPAASARLWASPAQMRALSRLAQEVVAQGRPICPLCQRPIDPEGHFCPRHNGHNEGIQAD